MAARGGHWELLLEGWHRSYAEAGRAAVFRVHPPVRTDPKTGRLYRAEQGPPDFMGYTPKRAVIFDAKAVLTKRFFFAKLPGHQALAFTEAERFGAFAFIALRCGAGDFVVPWRELAPAYRRWALETPGAPASLDPTEDGIPFGGYGWLSVVEALP